MSKKTLHIGYLPGRKLPALYFLDGSVLRPVSYFQSDEKMREVVDYMGSQYELNVDTRKLTNE